MIELAIWLVPGIIASLVIAGVGFVAGAAATVIFEWWTWARDLAPGRDD